MQIGRKDVIWNYAATFLQIGAVLLLFPFILRELPSEIIAVWTIFAAITAFVNLLNFGFNPSFTRNVSYVFSGAKQLKSSGFYVVEESNADVDYGLMKGLIGVMRFLYSRMAIILFALLATAGTGYVYYLPSEYSGNHSEVYLSWIILCIINSYSFYTLYYGSLLLGKGMVRRTKQIAIVGQLIYLIAAIAFILLGLGLVAIVSAQALAVMDWRYTALGKVWSNKSSVAPILTAKYAKTGTQRPQGLRILCLISFQRMHSPCVLCVMVFAYFAVKIGAPELCIAQNFAECSIEDPILAL